MAVKKHGVIIETPTEARQAEPGPLALHDDLRFPRRTGLELAVFARRNGERQVIDRGPLRAGESLDEVADLDHAARSPGGVNVLCR